MRKIGALGCTQSGPMPPIRGVGAGASLRRHGLSGCVRIRRARPTKAHHEPRPNLRPGLKTQPRRSGDVRSPHETERREHGEVAPAPIKRSRSRDFRRIDRGGCLLPLSETTDCSTDRPLRTSIRLAYRVIAAMLASIMVSAPRMTNSSPGILSHSYLRNASLNVCFDGKLNS